ncbi:hypothetical protein, partial [Bacillus sp. JJ1764]|uniref:hypothetical protein n=1 Tax=Bacillus sp. JJ1764 TaxID=3122964 RepID=UPI002FFFB6D5
ILAGLDFNKPSWLLFSGIFAGLGFNKLTTLVLPFYSYGLYAPHHNDPTDILFSLTVVMISQ